MVCIHFIDRTEHIICTRIHCLSAFNDIICTELSENPIHSFTDRYGYKTNRLSRFFFLLLRCLLSCRFFCVFDQFFLMLFPHVINLHSGKLTVCERFLNRKSRIVRVYMNFHNIIIGNTNDRIADRFKISFKLCFILICKFFFCHDNKFCTIAKLNIRFRLLGRFYHFCSAACFDCRIIYFFSKKCIIRPMNHFKQSLSSGIYNSRFL